MALQNNYKCAFRRRVIPITDVFAMCYMASFGNNLHNYVGRINSDFLQKEINEREEEARKSLLGLGEQETEVRNCLR